ncbi:MAG: response regulator transcription factor [Bacteroidia bacterium]|nr:response regulator transcription factor [Bacteroidia bacterium]
MKPIKVVLVDDHKILRDGIKSLLADIPYINIAGELTEGKELIEKIEKIKPDVIILDISLPDISGIEVTKILIQKYPEVKILILSMYMYEDFIFNSIKAGVKGYLNKNISKDELLEAIKKVYEGEDYFCPIIENIILKSYVKKIKTNKQEKKLDDLSKRELEILKYVVDGLSNQEIADKLFINYRTVDTHKCHIMKKLDLRSSVDLVKFALKNNIISL